MNIGILGAGTWGIAMARLLARAGKTVTVWSALPAEIKELSETRRHPKLPAMEIPQEIIFTGEIAEACEGQDLVVFAVPSVFVRATAASARPFLAEDQLIVDLAKGIEPKTMLTMSEVIREELQRDGTHADVRLVALSGPTHAEEVAVDLPTTIVSACADLQTAELVRNVFSTNAMRVYTNSDILGVELCGAMKNIIALAVGISIGLGYGDNAKAALITRGMAEIARLGKAMGCQERTFYGLAGVGDLIVTATSVHSRNNRAGILIGKGYTAAEAIAEIGMVVEGINAIPAAMGLLERYDIEMPLVSAAHAIICEGASPTEIVAGLMCRENKNEALDF